MLLRSLMAFGLIIATSFPAIHAQEAEGQAQEPAKLTIGSVAPPIDIEHWVSNGNGKFEAFNEFEDDKVYIIEFWATWCGPCIMSMPHLVETQQKYADKGVTIVSVSDEDLETVEGFLAKPVQSFGPEDNSEAAPSSYAELTSAYCLTTDPDGSVKNDYFRASGQRGIPSAFIVGKDGRIEWIGHPMEMDTPLELVVAGTFDREREFQAKQDLKKLIEDASNAAKEGDYVKYDVLLAKIEALDLPPAANETRPDQVNNLKSYALITKCTNAPEEVVAFLNNSGEELDFYQVLTLGSNVANLNSNPNQKISPELVAKISSLIETRIEAAEAQQLIPLHNVRASIHFSNGELDQAIESLKQAIAAAEGDQGTQRYLNSRLRRYMKEKAEQEEAEAAEGDA